MQIIISMDGRVMTVIRSSFIISRRESAQGFSLVGDNFQMTQISPDRVLIVPDDTTVEEGAEITPALIGSALPIETFLAASPEEAAADALGLVMRSAIASGAISDEELLRVAPALEGRQWKSGISATVGDVYAHGTFLWRCVQAHTTQSDWTPDATPALWHKVEIIQPDAIRVWDTNIEYAVDDVVAYPDASGQQYKCIQAHTSLEGWQPPNVPALWAPQGA